MRTPLLRTHAHACARMRAQTRSNASHRIGQ
jgi:hypothetical protein